MLHLITGGAGFIGTNYIRYILGKYPEDRVVCVDKLTYAGNYDNLKELEGNHRFVFEQVDICDRDAIYALFLKYDVDCVVNFAAESHVDRSIESPEVFLKTNILGTEVLLSAVNKYKIKRFHQISTDEVYGDLPLERPDLKFSEDSAIKTSSPYSASKASADLLCLAYFRTYGTPVTISRCSNNYGPYQFPEKLIPRMIEKAQRDEELPIYGDGKNVRDWIYVDDHCAAVDEIVRRGRLGEVYNVGGNTEKSNLEIIKIILSALGKPESLMTHVADRPGHDRRYAINSEKIKKELGFEPSMDFETGIGKTIKWYCDNPLWLERISSGEYRSLDK